MCADLLIAPSVADRRKMLFIQVWKEVEQIEYRSITSINLERRNLLLTKTGSYASFKLLHNSCIKENFFVKPFNSLNFDTMSFKAEFDL